MGKTNLNSFIKSNGRYIMEPSLFVHTWNLSSSREDVVNRIRQYWLQYANENILEPSKDGILKEPRLEASTMASRASHFRKKDIFMKSHPRRICTTNAQKYDWDKLRAIGEQYKKKADSLRESSPSKSFFSR